MRTGITASWRLFGSVWAALLAAGAGWAQEPQVTENKIVGIVRSNATPAIDGVLDEAVWREATLIDDLHQVDPNEFSPPSERTEIRIFYGDDALYVGARLWDTEADRITAQVLRQGEGLSSEDLFAVILDPYLDRRSGYRFEVNPNSVRWDALYENTTRLMSDWEGIWQAAATQDADGWTAEMSIPFKTISFNPNTDEWGINFERRVPRNDETIAWVSRNRQLNPGIAGTATGLTGLQQGRGLDIVPSFSVREEQAFGGAVQSDSSFDPSLDVFYKITPSLNGALTVNTDFSATEVDDRQVNLTRFGLFFPEKRDFFLQDADIFEFGRIGASGGGGGRRGGGGGGNQNPAIPGAARQNGLPFFSRRIGLSPTGQPVDIEYGGKLSGRAGRWNVGALAITQDAYEFTTSNGSQFIDSTDILIGRVAANVLEESAVGIIMTDGDPHSNDSSSLYGADFRYRNTRLPGNRQLESQVWYQESDNEGVETEQRAYGVGVSSPNATGWRGAFNMQTFEDNFDPAVGFVNRTGIRDYALSFGYQHRYRNAWLRSLYGGIDSYQVNNLATGEIESQIIAPRLTANNNRSDFLFSRFVFEREVLAEDFKIYDNSADETLDVVIPAGDYSWESFFVFVRTGSQRRLSSTFRYGTGEFYDGDRTEIGAELTWRPSEKLRLSVDYQVQDIDLPAGNFVVRQSTFRGEYVFSSTLSWVNLIQYDNISENFGINSRLHWVPQAGREGFIVLNHALSDADKNDAFHSTNADLSIKFSYTWRF